MVTEVREEQSRKAQSPIFVTELGMVIVTELGMVIVTELGMVTERKRNRRTSAKHLSSNISLWSCGTMDEIHNNHRGV